LVNARRRVDKSVLCGRGQDDDPFASVLRCLELTCPVEIATDQDLVADDVPALKREQLARTQTHVSGEEDHRPEGRTVVTVASEGGIRQAGDFRFGEGDEILAPARLLETEIAKGIRPRMQPVVDQVREERANDAHVRLRLRMGSTSSQQAPGGGNRKLTN
jgi:hypothetical protein